MLNNLKSASGEVAPEPLVSRARDFLDNLAARVSEDPRARWIEPFVQYAPTAGILLTWWVSPSRWMLFVLDEEGIQCFQHNGKETLEVDLAHEDHDKIMGLYLWQFE